MELQTDAMAKTTGLFTEMDGNKSRIGTLPQALTQIEALQAEIAHVREMLRCSEAERIAKERLFRDTIKREVDLRRELFVEYNTPPERKQQKPAEAPLPASGREHAEEITAQAERKLVSADRRARRQVPLQRFFALFAARS